MEFTKRKDVMRKISLLERLSDDYENKFGKEFMDEYLGNDCIKLSRERIESAIKRLKEEHDKIPLYLLYEGPYYLRNHKDFVVETINESLVIKNGGSTRYWYKVKPSLNLCEVVSAPYKDVSVQILITPEDARPVCSDEELKSILKMS